MKSQVATVRLYAMVLYILVLVSCTIDEQALVTDEPSTGIEQQDEIQLSNGNLTSPRSPVLQYLQSCTTQDRDCDGIPDQLEQTLLETYRPFFRFSRDNGDPETFRPADVGAYLQSSEIDGNGKEGDRILLSQKRLSKDLGQLLTFSSNNISANVLQNSDRTKKFYINPANSNRRGATWSDVLTSRKVGLYGHVVPIHLTSSEQYDRKHVQSSFDNNFPLFYKIEYWQFFGYSSNNKPFDEGDHEGDWDTVQLIYRPGSSGSQGQIVTVLFYAHGQEMAFDMSSQSGSLIMENGTVLEIRGSRYNMPVPNLHDDGAETNARNHVLRLFRDPVSGQFTHPVVFVEHGGHEFWPSPFWSFIGAQKHDGDDIADSYLAATPPNLGEVEHPLNNDPIAAVIMQFNGFWGTYSRSLPGIFSNNPPPGPALHYAWTWPATSQIRRQLQGLE